MRLAERVEWVAEHVGGKDVLDVGCTGINPRVMDNPDDPSLLHPRIAERSKSVLGIDINREGIERMRALGYNVIYANAEGFVSHHKFDVVVLGECIEHVENPGLVVDRAWENLRDDGHLIVTTPNARYLGVALREMLGANHFHIYTLKLLRQTLEHHGFKITELRFFKPKSKFSLNMMGTFYERVFLRVFPQLAPHFGVVAEKEGRG